MTSKDEDAEIAEGLRGHLSAQGPGCKTEADKLRELSENAPLEQLEKAFFGATLDDIMNLSDFADLENEQVELVRQSPQDANSAPFDQAPSRRDHTAPGPYDDSAPEPPATES